MNFKKLLSYLWPQTIKVESDCNGILEVTYYNGKKMLDSKNANYSYGSLQKILEFGIDKVQLEEVNSVLILGLGAGSVVTSLRNKFLYKGKITAVEFDKKVIDIAKTSFGLEENELLNIIYGDAFDFLKKNKNTYDLIIVDLFVDQKVPKQFYSQEFCNYLYQSISIKGSLIFNIGIHQHDDGYRNKVKHYLSKLGLKTTQYNKILTTNSLLIANK